MTDFFVQISGNERCEGVAKESIAIKRELNLVKLLFYDCFMLKCPFY